MTEEVPMTDKRVSQSGIKLARRSFLRVSAIAAGSAATYSVMRMPSFAGLLPAESPVASTTFGKVRGYTDNGINVFKGIRYGADTTSRRKQLPRWELYALPRRRTMVFDAPSHLEDDPRGAERRLFAKVPYVQPGT